jgi:hypothetical protein
MDSMNIPVGKKISFSYLSDLETDPGLITYPQLIYDLYGEVSEDSRLEPKEIFVSGTVVEIIDEAYIVIILDNDTYCAGRTVGNDKCYRKYSRGEKFEFCIFQGKLRFYHQYGSYERLIQPITIS